MNENSFAWLREVKNDLRSAMQDRQECPPTGAEGFLDGLRQEYLLHERLPPKFLRARPALGLTLILCKSQEDPLPGPPPEYRGRENVALLSPGVLGEGVKALLPNRSIELRRWVKFASLDSVQISSKLPPPTGAAGFGPPLLFFLLKYGPGQPFGVIRCKSFI